ncbi:hypothetical protein ES703_113501 [subsurface metagenome]
MLHSRHMFQEVRFLSWLSQVVEEGSTANDLANDTFLDLVSDGWLSEYSGVFDFYVKDPRDHCVGCCSRWEHVAQADSEEGHISRDCWRSTHLAFKLIVVQGRGNPFKAFGTVAHREPAALLVGGSVRCTPRCSEGGALWGDMSLFGVWQCIDSSHFGPSAN